MKIDSIFEIVKRKLFSIKFENNVVDEFTQCFRNWNDPEYLEDFFENNLSDLQSGFYGNITVEEAVMSTIYEAEDFESNMLYVAKHGKFEKNTALGDVVFKPLHDNDYSIHHLKSKAYGAIGHTWIRLYAIRITSEIYVVTGGAIKLTRAMQERYHTKQELLKLNIAKKYLEKIGLIDEVNYEQIEIQIRHE